MQTRTIIVAALTLLFITSVGQATLIEYHVGADDYALLKIDGVIRGSYDAYPSGGFRTGVLDLAPGWHGIDLIYKNRWGSNALNLNWIEDELTSWPVVAMESLRSLDAQGNWINGLKADYYELSGTYLTTIYGEGPIEHGARYGSGGQLLTYYQSVWPAPWAGIFDGWSTFEERLTGQILVPEPVSMAVLALGGIGMLLRRRSHGVRPPRRV